MAAHKTRQHALISPSGLHRDLYCTAAPLLTKDMPNEDTVYSKEGTYAHEVCELMLRRLWDRAWAFKAENEITKVLMVAKSEGYDDQEMARHAVAYKDYVEEVMYCGDYGETEPTLMVEQKLDLTTWIPNGFGIADCVLVGGERLTVIDFKYGQSPKHQVSAVENWQMIAYALGAYDLFSAIYDIKKVDMHIYQPRVPDGISTYELPIEELLKRGEFIKTKVLEALSGHGVFAPSPEVCRFCKARDVCKARAESYLKMQEMSSRNPALLTPEEMAEAIRIGEGISDWLDQLRARALAECLEGHDVPGFKAVEGRATRTWTDMTEAFRRLQEAGIAEAILYERKPLTLAAAEKAVGKKQFNDLVGELITKTPGKPALAPDSDRRPAISKVSAADIFGVNE